LPKPISSRRASSRTRFSRSAETPWDAEHIDPNIFATVEQDFLEYHHDADA